MAKKLMRGAVRLLLKPILHPRVPVKWQRRLLKPIGPTQPRVRGSSFEAIDMRGVPGRKITAGSPGNQALLYLHGGAYVTGSPGSHRGLMSHLARTGECTVFAPDYRLAPEHPYPAALDDALSAYQYLLEIGYAAENILIGGDSAGGGLALMTALAIRDRGLPQLAGMLLLSPWTDLSQSGGSNRSNKAIDPMLDPAWGAWAGPAFAGSLSLTDPAVSPLFAELTGLPPMLIQVASDEILLDDSRALADKAREAGVDVDIEIFDGLWHVFQLHTRLLKESMQAIDKLGQFIREAGTTRAST